MTAPLLLVDLETTSLDPRGRYSAILEIGLMVVSPTLDVVARRSWVIPYPPSILRVLRVSADEVVRDMHHASGLWEACTIGEHDVVVEHPFVQALRWVTDHAPDPATPLTGSSVHFDRRWLEVHLPRILDGRTYRLADVSGMRELLTRFGPAAEQLVAARPAAASSHRVDADLDATLVELRHYRDAVEPALQVHAWWQR